MTEKKYKFYCRETKNEGVIVQNVINDYFGELNYYTKKDFRKWIEENNMDKKDIIYSKNIRLKERI